MTASIVGPVCETGDTFARDRVIDAVKSGDLAAFRTAGAYGATMASTYNSRSLVPEVLVVGDRYITVADRIDAGTRLEENKTEHQSLMCISYTDTSRYKKNTP